MRPCSRRTRPKITPNSSASAYRESIWCTSIFILWWKKSQKRNVQSCRLLKKLTLEARPFCGQPQKEEVSLFLRPSSSNGFLRIWIELILSVFFYLLSLNFLCVDRNTSSLCACAFLVAMRFCYFVNREKFLQRI